MTEDNVRERFWAILDHLKELDIPLEGKRFTFQYAPPESIGFKLVEDPSHDTKVRKEKGFKVYRREAEKELGFHTEGDKTFIILKKDGLLPADFKLPKREINKNLNVLGYLDGPYKT